MRPEEAVVTVPNLEVLTALKKSPVAELAAAHFVDFKRLVV